MRNIDQLRGCAQCGAQMLAEQRICTRCGVLRRRTRRVRCRVCGAVNRRGLDVCTACGEPLGQRRIRLAAIALVIVMGALLLVLSIPWQRQGLGRMQSSLAVSTAPPTSSEGPTVTQAPASTPTPRQSNTPSLTNTPTATSTSSPTTRPTRTPKPTLTYTSTPTNTPTYTPTATPTATATPTRTPAPTRTSTATPAGTATAPSSASPTPFIYVVKAGDTLYDIASKFNTTVAAIMEANGLEDSRLRVGQKLIIPLGPATPVPTPSEILTPTPSQ